VLLLLFVLLLLLLFLLLLLGMRTKALLRRKTHVAWLVALDMRRTHCTAVHHVAIPLCQSLLPRACGIAPEFWW
jgi:hypothetical protein